MRHWSERGRRKFTYSDFMWGEVLGKQHATVAEDVLRASLTGAFELRSFPRRGGRQFSDPIRDLGISCEIRTVSEKVVRSSVRELIRELPGIAGEEWLASLHQAYAKYLVADLWFDLERRLIPEAGRLNPTERRLNEVRQGVLPACVERGWMFEKVLEPEIWGDLGYRAAANWHSLLALKIVCSTLKEPDPSMLGIVDGLIGIFRSGFLPIGRIVTSPNVQMFVIIDA